jgi:hypothetical protein
MHSFDQRPQWDEVAVPWEPQPIAWRYNSHDARKAALREQASATARSHIVREILAEQRPSYRRPQPGYVRTPGEAEDTLAATEDEFNLLRANGVQVPDVLWHIFRDDKTVRILARLAIIQNLEPIQVSYSNKASSNPHQLAARAALQGNLYAYWQSPGYRVREFRQTFQYVYGSPQDACQAPDYHLVDVEPLMWTLRVQGEPAG